MTPVTKVFIKEEELLELPNHHQDYDMVKLEEDAILCGFNPWFRGLNWSQYRRYVPRTVPPSLAQVFFDIFFDPLVFEGQGSGTCGS